MRRILALCLLGAMCFGLFGCGKETPAPTSPIYTPVTAKTHDDVSALPFTSQIVYYLTEYRDSFAFTRLHKPFSDKFGVSNFPEPYYVHYAEAYRLEGLPFSDCENGLAELFLLDISCNYLVPSTQEEGNRLRLVIDRQSGEIYDSYFLPNVADRMQQTKGVVTCYEDLICLLLTCNYSRTGDLYSTREGRIPLDVEDISLINAELMKAVTE